jgi:hypothetical protein
MGGIGNADNTESNDGDGDGRDNDEQHQARADAPILQLTARTAMRGRAVA